MYTFRAPTRSRLNEEQEELEVKSRRQIMSLNRRTTVKRKQAKDEHRDEVTRDIYRHEEKQGEDRRTNTGDHHLPLLFMWIFL
jgi:hypothetical protein